MWSKFNTGFIHLNMIIEQIKYFSSSLIKFESINLNF